MFASSRPAPARNKKNEARLGVEALEDRLALAWAGVPPAQIAPPSSFTGLALNSAGDANRSASIANDEVDYYRFTAGAGGTYSLEALTPSGNLDTVLGVFSSAGERLAYNDDIGSGDTDSRLAVTLAAGQRCIVGVTNFTGTPGGGYVLRIEGPRGGDDAFENNDTRATAYNLGALSGTQTIGSLAMNDSADWFRFSLSAAGTAGARVAISFSHAQGDLDLRLYSSAGALLRTSDGTSGSESVSLSGLAAGTYYAQVYGYRGARNPNYSMTLAASEGGGSGGGGSGGNRVLYLNFDGATISRTDLVRWANGQWDPDGLDSDRNGIAVQRFLSGRGDREAIIGQIINMVQADLSAYGVTVRRHTGLAVEGQGATTIFLGQSTLTDGGYHIACDVDIGNNNLTDIAFVGNEDWGSANDTAIALADVTLHEAGHTWGLWHVASGAAIESMGLRYNTDQSEWVQNTRFLDQTFQAYSSGGFAHGPGPINTHRTMLSAFNGGGAGGFGGNLAQEPHEEHGEQHDCWLGRPHGSAAERTSGALVDSMAAASQAGMLLHRSSAKMPGQGAQPVRPPAARGDSLRPASRFASRFAQTIAPIARNGDRAEAPTIDNLFASLLKGR